MLGAMLLGRYVRAVLVMRLLYSLVLYLAVPVLLLRLLWRARRAPAYARRWGERFGWVAPLATDKTVIWLHTVSVGEFLGALPLIRALMQDPERLLLITTTTPTGSERVRQTLGRQVVHVYAPYDLPGSVERFLQRVQPRVLLIMETELWPNTLAACARWEIPTLLINGRLSERSARGYARVGALTRPMLQALTEAGLQSRADAERFQTLGLRPEATHITGNIKFDLSLEQALRDKAARLRQAWSRDGKRPIWIAASTHKGEDELILSAYVQARVQLDVNPLLVLVPRHPERFEVVAQLCRDRELTLVRRSEGASPEESVQVLLGDTMGELLLLLGTGDVVFVGGSLMPRGGHNLIEPAVWGLPLLSGPSLYNFAEVSRLLREAGALTLVDSQTALAEAWVTLTKARALRKRQGQASLAVTQQNTGAMEKTLAMIDRYT